MTVAAGAVHHGETGAAPPPGEWVRAHRQLSIPAALVRREVIGTLRGEMFRVDTEQLGYVVASRGSVLGVASGRPEKFAVVATVWLAEQEAGCAVWIQLTDRGLVGVARMTGTVAGYRSVFERIMTRLDHALIRLNPSSAATFGAPVYSSPAATGAGLRGVELTGRGLSNIGERVGKVLNAPTSAHASRSWEGRGAYLCSPAGVAALELSDLQAMASIGTQLVENPGSVPPEQVARVARLVQRLDAALSVGTRAGVARLEISEDEVPVVEFLRQQARIRDLAALRLRQRCRTCDAEKLINPDYKKLMAEIQRKKTLLTSFGAIIGRGGKISPMVLVGRLILLKQFDPDYVCPRCQGLDAETIMITFCPSCKQRHDESVLRSCSCDYDFRVTATEEILWHPAATAGAASGPAVPAGWHRDPTDPDQLRWWDGVRWSEHVHLIIPTSPTPETQ